MNDRSTESLKRVIVMKMVVSLRLLKVLARTDLCRTPGSVPLGVFLGFTGKPTFLPLRFRFGAPTLLFALYFRTPSNFTRTPGNFSRTPGNFSRTPGNFTLAPGIFSAPTAARRGYGHAGRFLVFVCGW